MKGDSVVSSARNHGGTIVAGLAFRTFSVEISKKRDARRNFSQYLKGDNVMGESVQCQTERCML
jgi:hypothetical protein